MINRREFIKTVAATGGGFALSVYLPAVSAGEQADALLDGWSPWLFITVNDANVLEITSYKQEIGQGTSTAVAMFVAEELGADWNLVAVKPASLDQHARDSLGKRSIRWGASVGGSGGARFSWIPMREAGAAVRHMFIEAAATRWQVNKQQCRIESSVVYGPQGQALTLAELADDAANVPVPDKVTLKPDSAMTLIGKSVSNLRQKDYVTGAMQYTIDIQLPGMVYAAIERCPVFHGKVKSFNDRKARAMPGVLDIIEIPSLVATGGESSRAGVAVIAQSTWQAFEARKALEIEWDYGSLGGKTVASIEKQINDTAPSEATVRHQTGDIERAFKQAKEIVSAQYTNHYQEHGHIEPMVAVAHYHQGKLDLWAPVQAAKHTADSVADTVGIPAENITLHCRQAGGSFGRKYARDYTNEVAYLARRCEGPVKLTWTREDCTQNGEYHPFRHTQLQAAIDDHGDVSGVRVNTFETSRRRVAFAIPYRFANYRHSAVNVETLVELGAWRSVHEHRTAFAIESFIDELAHHLSQDPIALRLTMIPDPSSLKRENLRTRAQRAKHVLEHPLTQQHWQQKLPAGYGKGIALGKMNETLVAQIATVRYHDNRYTVEKVFCIADSGKVFNPQMAKGQLEGSILWALAAAMDGGIDFELGRVRQSNFHDNPIVRFADTPQMQIHLLESDGPVGGFGEPGVPPLAPAVLNACYAASGKRMRTIPMKWHT